MSTKRKRVVLSLLEKFEIIKRLKNGETAVSLAAEFNIGVSTIADIKKSEERLVKFMNEMENGVLNRKSMRSGKDGKLDSALYQWFSERRNEGEIVTGPALCEKALELHEKIGASQDFKASSGWLQRFKLRHGIKVGERCTNETAKVDIIEQFDDCIKKYQSEFSVEAEEKQENEYSIVKEEDIKKESSTKRNTVKTSDNFSPDSFEISTDVEKKYTTNNGTDIPSNSEALLALHTALKWYEHQDDVDNSLLTSLTRIRDVAAKKTLSNFFMLT